MIKGSNRRVVVMKNTGSDYFDEAYFLIKENLLKTGKSPVSEAKKIIRELDTRKRKSVFLSPLFLFLSGCVIGLLTGIFI